MVLDPMEQRLNRLENDIQKLKVLYEQYFRGVASDLPQTLADAVGREVRTLSTTVIQNTSFKFRSQQLVARYNAYLHVWQKSLRDIEDGKVKRRRVGPEKAQPALETNTFVFSNPDAERNEMDRMIHRVQLEYKRLGSLDTPESGRIRRMVEEQTQKVKARYGVAEVAYEVAHEGEKVRIKVKPVATKSNPVRG